MSYLNEADRHRLELIKTEFPMPYEKGTLERKQEEGRRQGVIQRYCNGPNGLYKYQWGMKYGPFFTMDYALRALRRDKDMNPGLY